jgi:sensor histidine kinase YesM
MALINPPELDKPLPEEVVATSGNWLVRYRMYPVFSWRWFVGRTRLTSVIVLTLMALITLSLLGRRGDLPASTVIPALALNALVLVMLTSFAPLVACVLRAQGWAYAKQSRAIVVGVALAIAANLAINHVVSEHITKMIERPVAKTERLKREAEMRAKPLIAQIALYSVEQLIALAQIFVLGGGLATVAYFRERQRLLAYAKKLELAAEQAARHEAELRLSVLQAQVEPHFLFNTLAGLRSLIAHDPPKAVILVDKLVDYLRATIPRMRADGAAAQSLLGMQLDAVSSYLDLMQIRMEERLSFSVEAEPGLRDLPFPPLMLITLVENAIKHGLEPKTSGGKLAVIATRTVDTLSVSVADNGAGFGNSTASGSGIGLANVRTQLLQMYGDKARLELLTKPLAGEPSGFTAVITVPIETLV